ncbi:MAG: thiamine diphosphokinase [Anaerolineae bacterium]|nr:thiamine diphosphokinase [Anaerolineae bacterium]
MRALVFANGDLNDGPAVRAALSAAEDALIIAADGGARLALACGLAPALVIGDLDSLSEGEIADLRERGAAIERVPTEKDETDLELALLEAARRGADQITLIGAAGGRLDHMLANIYLLAMPELRARAARVVAGRQTLWLIGPGAHTLEGALGDTVSLLPLTPEAAGIVTEGLAYPLRGESLRIGAARGVSNVMQTALAHVTLGAGLLLVVHTQGRA